MMRMVLVALFFLTVYGLAAVSQVKAACTGSELTWTCSPSGGSDTVDIQSAITSATSGATITFTPGIYSITSALNVSITKGITLICATAPLAIGAATINACQINTGSNTRIGNFSFGNATYNQCYRFSGFIFDMQGVGVGSGFGGLFQFDNHGTGNRLTTFFRSTLTCLRFDHNTYQNGVQSAVIYRFGQVGASSILCTVSCDPTALNVGNYYGVADHNIYTGTKGYEVVFMLNNLDGTPPAAQAGTGNNFFIEDSIFSFTLGTTNAAGCTDGWGGYAVVVRFNFFQNCRWAVHGEKHEAGPNNLEFYGNQVTFTDGMDCIDTDPCAFFENGTWAVQHQGSGEFLVFNNSFIATLTPRSTWVIEAQNYRDSHNGDTTQYSPDLGGGMPMCDGTVVNFGGANNLQGASVTDGNRDPIATYRGYPCFHQMGRDRAHVLKPVYLWNNYFADTLANVYNGSTFLNSIGGSPNYFTEHTQQNRDYYFAVSASAQSNNTTPFNGSTGMGFGTLANRPTTCTPTPEALDAGNGGVGYWATDQGNWKNGTPLQGVWIAGEQGVLFKCKATNTWTTVEESYHPYNYPHPMTTVVAQVRGPAASGGLRFTGGVRY
jgi:hypothetical protein